MCELDRRRERVQNAEKVRGKKMDLKAFITHPGAAVRYIRVVSLRQPVSATCGYKYTAAAAFAAVVGANPSRVTCVSRVIVEVGVLTFRP